MSEKQKKRRNVETRRKNITKSLKEENERAIMPVRKSARLNKQSSVK